MFVVSSRSLESPTFPLLRHILTDPPPPTADVICACPLMVFWPKLYNFESKFCTNQVEVGGFCGRKRLFLPKDGPSSETASFGCFGISAEINFFEEPSFGFRQKDKNYLSVDHYVQ